MTPFIKKTLFAATLVLGGAVAVIFIFGNADPLKTEVAQKNPVIRFESVSSLASYQKVVPSNATLKLAEEIAAELIAQNPEGPQGEEGARKISSINPEELAQKAVESIFSELKPEDLRPEVKVSDLVVVKTNENSFAQAYFNSVNRILTEQFPPTLSVNWDDPVQTDFPAFISAFEKSASELKKVPVPQSLAPLHRELITLIGAQRNAFALIKNYQIDPAQAALAIEAGNRLGAELKTLLLSMNAYIEKNGIVLTMS